MLARIINKMNMWLRLQFKFVILHILLGMCYTIPTFAIEVKPTDFPMQIAYPMGKEKSQLKVTIDYAKYPPGTTEANFSTLDRQVPESLLAEYTRILRSNKNNLTGFTNLYLPNERQEIEKDYERLRQEWHETVKGIKFLHRFNIGRLVYISYEFDFIEKTKDSGGFSLSGAEIILTNMEEGYFIGPTTINLGPPIDRRSFPWLLKGGIAWNLPKEVLSDNYKYTLTIPGPLENDPPSLHPMKASFNGTICKTLIDEKTGPEDKITEFIKKVVLTYRHGSDEEWLSLWPKDEAEWWRQWAKAQKETLGEHVYHFETYGMERNRFDKKVFLLYKIDFGPSVLVHYQNGEEIERDNKGEITNIKTLIFWKSADGKYRLTSGTSPNPDSYEDRFSYNIKAFFESELFLNFLMKQLQPQQSNVGK